MHDEYKRTKIEITKRHMFYQNHLTVKVTMLKNNTMDEDKKIEEYRDYLDHILDDVDPKIVLDDEQRRAVVSDADRALVIAGAGTGKTTTMVARVKYLVDKKHIDPRKILVLSFARKNVKELRDRIWTDLKIKADVSTFHSLGLKYLKKACADRGHKCYVVDERDKYKIFEEYLREKVFTSKESIDAFYNSFKNVTIGRNKPIFRGYFSEHHDKFSNFDEYFDGLIRDKLTAWGNVADVIKTIKENGINADTARNMKHEWFRSKGEAAISNFLLEHGIPYEYEKYYEEIMPEDVPIKPDFTLKIGGEEIIVEYFGLYEEGGDVYFKSYQKERDLKIERFKRDGKRYITLEYEPNYGYLTTLENKLKEYGFKLNKLSTNEIAEIIIKSDPLCDLYRACKLFNRCIERVKASLKRNSFKQVVERELERASTAELGSNEKYMRAQFHFIYEYFLFYQEQLKDSGSGIGLDYSDMIYFAKNYIKSMDKNYFAYEYVLIDEYQDISYDRYELVLKTLEHGGAKLMAIGDDWQSIYGFTGSSIEYTYNFANYYNSKDIKVYRISHTYRFSDELAKISGNFIMKNSSQIEKTLYSNKKMPSPIRVRNFSSGTSFEERQYNELEALAKLITDIHTKRPKDKILLISRNNYAIDQLFKYEEIGFKDEVENRVSLKRIKDFMFEARTIHTAKGMTSDWTIVFGLGSFFPREHIPDYWIIELFAPKTNPEGIRFAEERRVFYVALTRTKNCVFLMKCENDKYCSPFIEEILKLQNEYNHK